MHTLCPMLCLVSAIMCTTTMARGGSLLLLLTLAWSGEGSGVLGKGKVAVEEQESSRTVVVEIQDVNQPYNCSAFFDSLEVGLLS